MRCKACRQPMRPVTSGLVPVVLPAVVAVAGLIAGGYLISFRVLLAQRMFPVATALMVVSVIGAVLLAAMHKQAGHCEACGATEPMDAADEARFASEEESAMQERMRRQLAEELRPEVERELRPAIEHELRPQLADELRTQFEEELRPQLAEEIRAQLTREIEKQLKMAMQRPTVVPQTGAVARPTASQPSQPSQPAYSPTRPPSGPVVSQPPRGQTPQPVYHPPPVIAPPFLAPVGSVTDPHARAQRRARVIVSDIALYHREMIQNAVRAADPKRAMDTVWEEAVRSYNESISEEVRRNTNYLGDAFDALIQRMRKEQSAG